MQSEGYDSFTRTTFSYSHVQQMLAQTRAKRTNGKCLELEIFNEVRIL
jgi:hypothetical protein